MPASQSATRRTLRTFAGPAVLLALILFMLHQSLFSGGTLMPAGLDNDLTTQFLGWRYFGFSQWRDGHFPFWNPHVFCGIPFFAQSQSAMLYPINWIHLFISTITAANIEIACNVFIAGLGAFCWARRRGVSRCGATLSGIAFAFSAPFYLRVLAGHLAPLASIAWLPIGFLAIDSILALQYFPGILIGALAICLQWLGGSPQYVYYGMIVGGLYALLHSIGKNHFWKICLATAAMYALGIMLASAQLLPSVAASRESIRTTGLSENYIGTFSLPPENLASLIIPYPLGDLSHSGYVGRWYLWETSAYLGLINFALACIALAYMRPRWRMALLLITIVVLSLGYYTPVHWWLYRFLPGFSLFRGSCKFASLLVLFLSILAGEGFDRIRQNPGAKIACALTIAAIICIALAATFHWWDSPHGPASRLLTLIYRSGSWYDIHPFLQQHLVRNTSQRIGLQWLIAGGLLAAMAALVYLRRWFTWSLYLLLVLAALDVYVAAWDTSAVNKAQLPYPAQWTDAIEAASAGDQRVLYADSGIYSNSGNIIGGDSLWGYDPAQPARYTLLIAASQHEYPTGEDQYYPKFQELSRILQLLRCRFVLRWQAKAPITPIPNPMPRLQLLGDYARMDNPRRIVANLANDFDFRTSAILESQPNIEPQPAGATGQVYLLHQSINDMEIEANLPAPALLLITDAYSAGWRVRPIQSNPNQSDYQVLPADEALRAIPLAAGYHHFDLYYFPPGFTAGLVIPITGGLLWLGGLIVILKPKRK
jgi:hypothetical protein